MTDLRLPEELIGKLKEVERRLRWSDALDLCLRAAGFGLAAGILLSLLGRMLDLGSPRLLLVISAAVVLFPAASTAAYGLTQRRTLLHVARICDRRLGLKERLSTALEVTMVGTRGPVIDAQLLDARRSLDAVDWRRAFSLRVPVRPALAAVVLLGALMLTFRLPHPLSGMLSNAGVVLPDVTSLTSGQVGAAPLSGISTTSTDADRVNEVAARSQELADDIAGGQVPRAEIVDRLNRAEFDLRLLTRSSPDQGNPAPGLDARLKSLRRDAALSESVRQRDYQEVTGLLRELGGRLLTTGDDERVLTARILFRAGRDEAASSPELAQALERASSAVSLADRRELFASIDALEAAINLTGQRPSSVPLDAPREEPLPPQ